MTGHQPLAFEGLTDDHRFKVMAIAIDRDVLTGEAIGNVFLDIFRGDHLAILSQCPRSQRFDGKPAPALIAPRGPKPQTRGSVYRRLQRARLP